MLPAVMLSSILKKAMDRFQLPVLPRNPCDFAEGSIVKSIYSGRIYVITQHYKNGMCNMFQPSLRINERWNACNNQHFIPADYVSPAVQLLVYA